MLGSILERSFGSSIGLLVLGYNISLSYGYLADNWYFLSVARVLFLGSDSTTLPLGGAIELYVLLLNSSCY